jgi:hypothetical protein
MRLWMAMVLLGASVGVAQEGFPLDGTWRGERAGAGKVPETIVMVLQWDGQKISGVINPGPDAIQISDATLTPEGWKVAIAAQGPKGKAIRFEGAIEHLGEYNRAIAGTWTEGGKSSPLRMVRE